MSEDAEVIYTAESFPGGQLYHPGYDPRHGSQRSLFVRPQVFGFARGPVAKGERLSREERGRLKAAMKRGGITQRDLSQHVSRSENWIHEFLNGKNKAGASLTAEIRSFLGVEP